MKTALGFLAWMVRYPTITMQEVLKKYEALPTEEKAKVKQAFEIAKQEGV